MILCRNCQHSHDDGSSLVDWKLCPACDRQLKSEHPRTAAVPDVFKKPTPPAGFSIFRRSSE
jgi:hypothetical protein